MLEFPVDPMKAVLGTMPADEEAWAFELKWDGYRTLAFVDGEELRLQSSNRLDVTAKYPELAALPGAVNARRAVLDGELVVLDDRGRPRFELMQNHRPGAGRPAAFVIFDVLRIDDHDTVDLAYEQRRTLLEGLVESGSCWRVTDSHAGGGSDLLAVTVAQGLEGVMAKRLGSRYLPGKRSPNWRKVKNRIRAEVVIGGFTGGTGNRASTFGSLLVGLRDDGGALRFAGGVGTGFTHQRLEELRRRFDELATPTCPFEPLPPREYRRDATWLRPELSARIELTEWTNEGFVRHASFLDLC